LQAQTYFQLKADCLAQCSDSWLSVLTRVAMLDETLCQPRLVREIATVTKTILGAFIDKMELLLHKVALQLAQCLMHCVSLVLLVVLKALLSLLRLLLPLCLLPLCLLLSLGNDTWCDGFGWERRPTTLLSTSLMKSNPVLQQAHVYATPSHISTMSIQFMMDYRFVLILPTRSTTAATGLSPACSQ